MPHHHPEPVICRSLHLWRNEHHLKDKNAFDGEAQKEAFKKTSDAVMLILSQEAKDYLSTIYGDLNQYIITQIEASVNENKKKPVENNE